MSDPATPDSGHAMGSGYESGMSDEVQDPGYVPGAGIIELHGTETQLTIIRPCFNSLSPSFIRFPWERLSPPAKLISIGWADLNAEYAVTMRLLPAYETNPRRIPGHLHTQDGLGNEGHLLPRCIEGRWWIAGIFWTDGRIYVDARCEAQPDLAREVVAAEVAHSVDYFLPLSDTQKKALMELWHPGGKDPHTWWEIQDYGAEYYTLGGEAFMAAFTLAYAPGIDPDQSSFTHATTHEQSAAVRQILGVPMIGEEFPQSSGCLQQLLRPFSVRT